MFIQNKSLVRRKGKSAKFAPCCHVAMIVQYSSVSRSRSVHAAPDIFRSFFIHIANAACVFLGQEL